MEQIFIIKVTSSLGPETRVGVAHGPWKKGCRRKSALRLLEKVSAHLAKNTEAFFLHVLLPFNSGDF